MYSMTYSEIQNLLNKANFADLPKLNITILRNVMVESMFPYLKFSAYKMGFEAKIKIGEYDNIVQESLSAGTGLIDAQTDCVLVFMRLETLSWDLARNFTGLSSENLKNEIARVQETILGVIKGIRNQSNAMILWHGFELPVYPAFGIGDSQMTAGQSGTIQRLNDFLCASLKGVTNAYFVDLNLCVNRCGSKGFYDQRYWHIGRAPYSRDGLREIAFEDFKFLRAIKGKNKKCLVLDCDNVLWGGIVGEDGLAGIKLSTTYPGSPYYELQQEALNLYHRGILIALCSKNNDADVWDVFRNHPDMVLKEKHIATAQINWEDKATNLKKIANELNIGLDSLVFLDDSDFEINLVREALPEVSTIHLHKDKTVEYREMLAAAGLFDTLTISAEDRQRGEMYKAESQRKQLEEQVADLDTYLKSLEMIVEIKLADEFTVPRIAQLTQKTNQFNLTTRRYSDADIKNFNEAADSKVFSLRLIDKFGDSGIVGVCVIKFENNKAIFDSFLLSCRVLGRGVEDVFIAEALKLAQKQGCVLAVGEFYPTSKNAQVKDFFPKKGFKNIPDQSDAAVTRHHFDLTGALPQISGHFKRIDSFVDTI